MPQTLRSLDRLFEFDPTIESIRIDLTRDTIRCEILRPDADTRPLIECESKSPQGPKYRHRFFTSNAIDTAVYELRRLLNFGVGRTPRRSDPVKDRERERAETLERLKQIRDIQSIKSLEGYEIRAIRESLEMSYDEFARALVCSTATVFRWETDRGRISNIFAYRLLQVMHGSSLGLFDMSAQSAQAPKTAVAGTPGVVDGVPGVWLPINPEPVAPLDPHWNDWPPQEPE